jgi:hypothetical protein
MALSTLTFDQDQLMTAIDSLTPVPLKGLDLLPHLEQADRSAVREAVLELIAYTNAAARLCEQLATVPAVPLTAFVAVDWAL